MPDKILSGWFSSSTPDLDRLLKVPFDYQPESEDECFVYCMWMVIHYIKNKHPSDQVREATRSLSPDEIMNYLTIVEGGWRPDQDELTLLSEKTRTINFNLQYWQDGSPKELEEFVREEVENGMPVVPFIKGLQLREGIRDDDGVHSVVAAGYGDEVAAIHDPWGYPEDVVKIERLEDAWDPMFNQIVTVSLSNRGTKLAGGNV